MNDPLLSVVIRSFNEGWALGETLAAGQADFIGRNLAKARLALGDAVLTAFGQYDWSVPERHRRLVRLVLPEPAPWLPAVLHFHAMGLEFKLHPRRMPGPAEVFAREHREISTLALGIWLWLESPRLDRHFASAREYAFSNAEKCPDTSAWRNVLLSMKTFGPKSALDPLARRYPRERLFNALALLLWNGQVSTASDVTRHLQKQLRTGAFDWTTMVGAYKQAWLGYG